MTSKSFHVLFARPEFKTMTIDEFSKLEFYKYGAYHAKIIGIDKRVMKTNSKYWYT